MKQKISLKGKEKYVNTYTLNSISKYALCYLTSTQRKWSLEIQNWLGLMCIEVLHKRSPTLLKNSKPFVWLPLGTFLGIFQPYVAWFWPTSRGILGTPKIHLRSATLWVLNKSISTYTFFWSWVYAAYAPYPQTKLIA